MSKYGQWKAGQGSEAELMVARDEKLVWMLGKLHGCEALAEVAHSRSLCVAGTQVRLFLEVVHWILEVLRYWDLFPCHFHDALGLLGVVVDRGRGSRNSRCLPLLRLSERPWTNHLDVMTVDGLSNPFLTRKHWSCWLGTLHRGIQNAFLRNAFLAFGNSDNIALDYQGSADRRCDIFHVSLYNADRAHRHRRISRDKNHTQDDP